MFNRRLLIAVRGDMGEGIKPEYYSQSGSTGYNRMIGYGDFSPWKNLTIKNEAGDVLHTFDLTYMYVSIGGSTTSLIIQLSNIKPPYTSDKTYGIYIKVIFPLPESGGGGGGGSAPQTSGIFYNDSASPSGASLVAENMPYGSTILRHFNKYLGEWIPCELTIQAK